MKRQRAKSLVTSPKRRRRAVGTLAGTTVCAKQLVAIVAELKENTQRLALLESAMAIVAAKAGVPF